MIAGIFLYILNIVNGHKLFADSFIEKDVFI